MISTIAMWFLSTYFILKSRQSDLQVIQKLNDITQQAKQNLDLSAASLSENIFNLEKLLKNASQTQQTYESLTKALVAGSIHSAVHARQMEAELPKGSRVIIINPDEKIEVGPDLDFKSVVVKNIIERDISYVYIVRRDQESLGKKIEKLLRDAVLNSTGNECDEKLRVIVISGSGQATHREEEYLALKAFCRFTVAIYENMQDESSSKILLVAPGFEPPFAIEVPTRTNALMLDALREYERFWTTKEEKHH